MNVARLLDTLEKHVMASSAGWANAPALARFETLALCLGERLEDATGREALAAAQGWAALLYSTPRHRRWVSGAAKARAMVLAHLQVLRDQLA